MNTRPTAVLAVVAALALPGFASPALASHAAGPATDSSSMARGKPGASSDGGTRVLALTDGSGNLTAGGRKAALTAATPGSASGTSGESGSASGTPGSARDKSSSAGGTAESAAPASRTESAPAASPQASPQPVTGYLYVSKPLAAGSFQVAGVTWNRGSSLPAGATVEVRTLDGGAWSSWYVLGAEDEAGKGRPGTEANVSGSSTGVQLRIKGSGKLPGGLRLDVVDGQGAERAMDPKPAAVHPAAGTVAAEVANGDEKRAILTDRAAGVQSTSQYGGTPSSEIPAPGRGSSAPAGAPAARSLRTDQSAAERLAAIQPRSAWGADESKMTWPRGYADFEGSIVHHTAGSNSYTKAQVPATIRGIYSYHANTREWGDIGYNVLIDKYGGRWEGRSGTLASPQGKVVTGAHAAPRNRGTLGVSVLGTYDNSNLPTPLVLETFSDVIAARFAIAGVDPSSRGTMSVPSGTGAALSAGSVLPRISGHKDVKATSCPGSIYGYLDQIRSRVAAKYAQLGGSGGPGAVVSAAVTWQYAADAIDVGASVTSTGLSDLQYRWLSYDLTRKKWTLISDWSDGNWATWRADAGSYWLQLQVRSRSDGRTKHVSTIAFQYVAGRSRITGTYAGWQETAPGRRHVLLGNIAPEAHRVVTKIYDVGAKAWVAQFHGPWAVWTPRKGVYWTRYEAYTADGRLADERTHPFRVD